MKFCECGSKLTKEITQNEVRFTCRCQQSFPGEPDDTLMYEVAAGVSGSVQLHGVFMDNAPHDPAALLVHKDCLRCGVDYLTIMYIGSSMETFYACTCGFRMGHKEYVASAGQRAEKAIDKTSAKK